MMTEAAAPVAAAQCVRLQLEVAPPLESRSAGLWCDVSRFAVPAWRLRVLVRNRMADLSCSCSTKCKQAMLC